MMILITFIVTSNFMDPKMKKKKKKKNVLQNDDFGHIHCNK